MSSDEPFYLYLRNTDDSWRVVKFKSLKGEKETEYEITPSGQCSCKGFHYNNHCKHVEAVVNRFTRDGVEPEKARELRDKMIENAKSNPDDFNYEYSDWVMNNNLDIVGIEFDVHSYPGGADATMMWGRQPEYGIDIRFNLSRQAVA